MKRVLILSLYLPLLLACEKSIDYPLPQEPKKISIDARVLAGEPVRAYVGTTEPALSTDAPQLLRDAQVLLLEDGQVVDSLKQSSGLGREHYEGTYLPTAGHRYQVKVRYPGLAPAFGEDMVKTAVPITGYTTDSTNREFTMSFKDPAGKGDFYRLQAYFSGNGSETPLFLSTIDPLVDFFYDLDDEIFQGSEKAGQSAFLKDENFDGKTRNLRFKAIGIGGSGEFSDSLVLQLTRISEDFYKHEKSKGIQYVAGGNPLAEPVQVYSNISNGYGIVAGGNSDRVLIVP
ncbi:MAG: DUF4249 domain-containing protein [Owenweeksia sp.]|nr:DUF4249 domain-containing protein [Owenweeksia sp.]